MSFGEHLEELRSRVMRSVIAVVLGFLVALIFQDTLLQVMTRPHREAMHSLAREQEALRVKQSTETLRDSLAQVPLEVGSQLAGASLERQRVSDRYRTTLTRIEQQTPGAGAELVSLLGDLLRRDGLLEDRLDPIRQVEVGASSLRAALQEVAQRGELDTGTVADTLATLSELEALVKSWFVAARGPTPPAGGTSTKPTPAPGPAPSDLVLASVSRGLLDATDQVAQWHGSSGGEAPLRLLKYTDSFFAHIKVAFLAGLLLGLPWLTLELWFFVAAGLYPHERRSIFPFLPLSLTFLILGGMFAFFVLTPIGLTYLGGYGSREIVEMSFTLNDYLSLVITMILGMAVVFQLPLLMVFLSRAGFVDVKLFRTYRRYSILGALIVGALLTPPDVVTQLLMAGPLILLYETGIWASVFFARKSSPD